MMNENEQVIRIANNEYGRNFWSLMRGQPSNPAVIKDGETVNYGLLLPLDTSARYIRAIKERSVFHQVATVFNSNAGGKVFVADDTDEPAQWLAEDQPIDLGSQSDFTKYRMECHKLVSVIRLREDQACDIGFNLEDYLIDRFSRRFAKAEDNAFINGTGIGQTKGILHSTDGAQTGLASASANELTFDEVLSLLLSRQGVQG